MLDKYITARHQTIHITKRTKYLQKTTTKTKEKKGETIKRYQMDAN